MELTNAQIEQLNTITSTLSTLNAIATDVATQLAGKGFDVTRASIAAILVEVVSANRNQPTRSGAGSKSTDF